jgi:hypothetical protein
MILKGQSTLSEDPGGTTKFPINVVGVLQKQGKAATVGPVVAGILICTMRYEYGEPVGERFAVYVPGAEV